MEGYKDPFNRGTYPWGCEDAALLDWYRQLGEARRGCGALAEGEIIPVNIDNDDVVCFERRGGGNALLVAVNRSDRELRIPLSEAFSLGAVTVGDGRREGNVLILPPLSGAWIQPEYK